MKQFLSIEDVPDLDALLQKAFEIKAYQHTKRALGRNKSIGLIFLNPSLRTRISSQRAAMNLGLDVVLFDVNKSGWKLEFGDGMVMDGDSSEHVIEAAGVLGQFFDILAIRSFAELKNREEDYSEKVINAFVDNAGIPIINMESATGHPLQAFADLITIKDFQNKKRPKVVLSWAPHPKVLPQAVANSFVRWMKVCDVNLVVTNPTGYDLPVQVMEGVHFESDQSKALEEADFVYAKNWSSYSNYGQILTTDSSWMITQLKMALTNQGKFMHCLPVRRNVVVEDQVLDSSASIVLEQAANRIISMQTVLQSIIEAG